MKYDISVVVNAHREGSVAQASLTSLEESVAEARAHDKSVEIIAVLDCPDDTTSELFQRWSRKSGAQVTIASNGDLGYSRNDAARVAKGQWLAFLDADDLWSRNWLIEALTSAQQYGNRAIWHPELVLLFGTTPFINVHVDMESDEFDPVLFAARNYWDSLAFVKREVVLDIPYPKTDLLGQLGYEDWSWNILTAERQVSHKVVLGTAHAKRQKKGSLVQATQASGAMPHASCYFRNILARAQTAHQTSRDKVFGTE